MERRDSLRRPAFVATVLLLLKTNPSTHPHGAASSLSLLFVGLLAARVVTGQGTVTDLAQRYNARHKLFGHLFQGRYKAVVVDTGDDGYVQAVREHAEFEAEAQLSVTLAVREVSQAQRGRLARLRREAEQAETRRGS